MRQNTVKQSLVALVAIASGVISQCSDSSHPVTTEHTSVSALRAGSAVYAKFEADLAREPADNDFQKWARDINNYDVYIRDEGDRIEYTFALPRTFRGGPVLDGQ